ncbi:hypothetical protein KC721_03660 [Candidatus Woesebacteria bacterium]|nr:hypothetical protein [Candidatus Woesebacteria bacterium]
MQNLEVISHHVATLSAEKSALYDTMNIPASMYAKEYSWGSVLMASKTAKIDTFMFFVHSGTTLPESVASYLIPNQEQQVAQTIALNIDLGGGAVASQLAEVLQEYPNVAIIWYGHTRLVGDANRVYVDEQIPYSPYRGETLWSMEENSDDFSRMRELISAETVGSFLDDVSQLVAQHEPRTCLYFHSYDTKAAGGRATKTITDSFDSNSLRPAGMLFYENPQAIDRPFITAEHRDEVVVLISQLLSAIPYLETTGRSDVTVDEPYKAAESLLTYVGTLIPEAEQLFFEVRKDLFIEAPEDTTQAVVSFMLQAMQLLSK